jgi:hypothetical protein
VEQQKYISALPLLPPLSEKTLKTYYTVRVCAVVDSSSCKQQHLGLGFERLLG